MQHTEQSVSKQHSVQNIERKIKHNTQIK